MEHGRIKIRPLWGMHDQTFIDGKKIWFVQRLIEKTKDLEVQTMPLSALNIYNLYPIIESMNDFVCHIQKVNDANLKYPIILDQDGYVMDGRHRIAKAILNGETEIKYVRFDETPPPDKYKEE